MAVFAPVSARRAIFALGVLLVCAHPAVRAGESVSWIDPAWRLEGPPPIPDKSNGFSVAKAWSFEKDAENWWASKAVKLEVKEPGILSVQGEEDQEQWSFAGPPPVPAASNAYYLFQMEIRFESASPKGVRPSVWIGEYAKQEGQLKNIGSHESRPFKVFPLGEWQPVHIEFRAKPETTELRFSLSKRTKSYNFIDASIRNVRLLRTPGLAASWLLPRTPLPEILKRRAEKHPRLFFEQSELSALRFGQQDAMVAVSDRVVARARKYLADPPDYAKTMEDPRFKSDGSQSWQVEVGDAIPILAVAYHINRDEKFFKAAVRYIHASCGYANWGLGPYAGAHSAAGHQLLGLAAGYDLLFDKLDAGTRTRVRQTVRKRANELCRQYVAREQPFMDDPLDAARPLLASALFTSGLAFWDEEPEARAWLYFGHEAMLGTLDVLGPDGAHPMGVYLWEAHAEQLLRWADLAQKRLGLNVLVHPWFASTLRFGVYNTTPGSLRGQRPLIVGLGNDESWNYTGPDHLFRFLARQFRDPKAHLDERAVWLAGELMKAWVCHERSIFLNLCWSGLQVRERLPERDPPLPTFTRFDDLDWVSARSDWTPDATLLAVRAGPPFGHRLFAQRRFVGLTDQEPDCGAPILYGFGEILLRSAGSGRRERLSQDSNALVVNGMGQLGEDRGRIDYRPWQFAERAPRIERAAESVEADLIVMDLAPAYPAEAKLEAYRRTLLFVKPELVVVLDEVRAREPVDLQWFWHTEGALAELNGRLTAEGKTAGLEIAPLGPDGWVQSLEVDERLERNEDKAAGLKRLLRIKTTQPVKDALGLTVFRVRPVSPWDFPPPFKAEKTGDKIVLQTESRAYTVRLAPGTEAPLILEPRK